MLIRNCIILFLIVVFSLQSHSQKPAFDSTTNAFKSYILPSALMGSALIVEYSALKQDLQDVIPAWQTDLDDYFQYVPIATMWTADAVGIASRSSFWKQTRMLLYSELAMMAVVFPLKELTAKLRPDGRPRSFPSGHTAQAFVGATVLYEEFKDTDKWIAYSGYIFAGATGVFRVSNDRHWSSDVLMGAGLGILIPKVIYAIDRKKNKKSRGGQTFIIPTIFGKATPGVHLVHLF